VSTIQVVIEDDLLRSADRAARRLKQNRSALIRDALREHLRRLTLGELERRERAAYERTPDDPAEFAVWDRAIDWPEK
jgi:metal-responsive CopG/Arc/MetJ family transcriptional regulator